MVRFHLEEIKKKEEVTKKEENLEYNECDDGGFYLMLMRISIRTIAMMMNMMTMVTITMMMLMSFYLIPSVCCANESK